MDPRTQVSPLLIAESPLQVLPSLAEAIGLNEAIVLQQLHWRLRASRNEADGRLWVYDSYEEWQAQHFPFWSVPTIKRAFAQLRTLELVVTRRRPGSTDRTNWYSIDYARLAALPSDQIDPMIGSDRPDHGVRLIRSTRQESTTREGARSAKGGTRKRGEGSVAHRSKLIGE